MDAAWVEVNLDNLKNNIDIISKKIGSRIRMMAVVKADGYGHGGAAIAKCCLKHGVNQFAVARVQEGIKLRQQGIDASIVVLGVVLPEQVPLVEEYDLIPAVFDGALAEHLDRTGRRKQKKIKCHVRVDIGSTGFGVMPSACVPFMARLTAMEGLKVEGLFTHFSAAYREDDRLITEDLGTFNQVLYDLRARGLRPALVHAVSSPGVVKLPGAYYDMVRPGTCLYGMPSLDHQADWGLRPLMQLKARILAIKEQHQGRLIGYGSNYEVTGTTRLATVSIGYADNLVLLMLQKGRVLVGNKEVPVFGRSYMSHLLIDVTHVPGVAVGQEVIILGQQGNQIITAQELANQVGFSTTYCDVICLLSKAMPRIYVENQPMLESRESLAGKCASWNR